MTKRLLIAASVLALGTTLACADGAAAFQKCAGCHGAKGEKAALGKSKIISEMSKADIATALKGYKAGTYGGAMKGMMTGQVAALDDAAIQSIADLIGK